MKDLYRDAKIIIDKTIQTVHPGKETRSALKNRQFKGDIYLLAIGKAAYTMAKAASEELGDKIKRGIIITKYGHSLGEIEGMEIIEAGHPLPDDNSVKGAEKAIEMIQDMNEIDELIFLISGGGSALFEKPLPGITLNDIIGINSQLLSCGADITEINMIRKRLSCVKAGRFAELCAPAKIFTIIMSDVLGDKIDAIASGPAAPDLSTSEQAMNVIRKYQINVNNTVKKYIETETPKQLDNIETKIIANVNTLCESAAKIAVELGYNPYIVCTEMNCEAREAGRFISAIAKQINSAKIFNPPCAVIFGGETVVTIKGAGKGGRNQEIALSAARGIDGIDKLIIFSLGSDGTDGPTDAAGGIVDGNTCRRLLEKGMTAENFLADNDSYNGLSEADALIKTGPTGVNINDITVILCN